ncbi:LysR family transcriptional regulator [Actinomycetes bacterium KLBMP 9797]
MELRDIEIFLTLAQELHFGRTAERLHVTPAPVSQAIKKQERRIGATLFARTSRNVTLTPIGRQLFDDLQPIQRDLRESLERAALAARAQTGVLRLGMLGSNLDDLRPTLDAFRTRRPECALEIVHNHFSDPFGPLRRNEIDLQINWLPIEEPDLTIGPIVHTEPIVLAVSTDHPLAHRDRVHYEDLADYQVPASTAPDYWAATLVPSHTPSGRAIPRGPFVANFQEIATVVAAGNAVCPVHEHATRYYARPDIRYLPIADAPPAQWALVWRTGAETPLTRTFAGIAAEFATHRDQAGRRRAP